MTKDEILFAIQEVVAHAGGDWPDVAGEPEVLRRVKMLARMAANRYEVRVKKRDKTWSPWLRLGGGLVHPEVEVQIAAKAEERVPVVPPRAITASVVRDGGGEHPAFCLMVAYRSEKDAMDALNMIAQAAKPPASEDVRRAKIIAAVAQRWINDTTHLGALVYLNDLAWALNTLAHAPTPPDHVREQAELWRTLMDLPGATRRIWNHVLDEDVKEGANSIREALDAVREKRGA